MHRKVNVARTRAAGAIACKHHVLAVGSDRLVEVADALRVAREHEGLRGQVLLAYGGDAVQVISRVGSEREGERSVARDARIIFVPEGVCAIGKRNDRSRAATRKKELVE